MGAVTTRQRDACPSDNRDNSGLFLNINTILIEQCSRRGTQLSSDEHRSGAPALRCYRTDGHRRFPEAALHTVIRRPVPSAVGSG